MSFSASALCRERQYLQSFVCCQRIRVAYRVGLVRISESSWRSIDDEEAHSNCYCNSSGCCSCSRNGDDRYFFVRFARESVLL